MPPSPPRAAPAPADDDGNCNPVARTAPASPPGPASAAALSRPIAGTRTGPWRCPSPAAWALAIAVAGLGHISGAQAAVTWGLYGDQARSIAALGAPAPALAAGVSAARVLAAEAVVTFVLVLVVVAVATATRVSRGIAAMAIGAALAVAIVISGPVSGAGVNPARAIGPMILAGQFPD